MKSSSFFVLIVSMLVFGGFSGNAEAKTCRIFPGSGGEAVFPGWPLHHNVLVHLGTARTVWLDESCRKPTVSVVGDLRVSRPEWEASGRMNNVASGWRIYFWSEDLASIGKTSILTIKSGEKLFKIEVTILNSTKSIGLEVRRSERIAREAKENAQDAKEIAGSGQSGLEIALSPMVSLESPGHEGYGLALGVNAVLGRFAFRGMVQLGLSGRLSWHYYEQEVIGIAQNSDVMASEFDSLAMFLFRLRPVRWFAADVTTGFGLRIFTHDDAVTAQGQDLRIKGVEGRVAYHPIWAFNVGVKFYPHKNVYLGFQYGATVSLTRQVQNPNAEGGAPSKANVWNHFLFFNLGFAL